MQEEQLKDLNSKNDALIRKVKPKQEKKVMSARLDEETHATLQRYAEFLGDATHEYIIGESLKRLFRRDKEFKEWLDENHPNSSKPIIAESSDQERPSDFERCMIQRVLNSKDFLATLRTETVCLACVREIRQCDPETDAFDFRKLLRSGNENPCALHHSKGGII